MKTIILKIKNKIQKRQLIKELENYREDINDKR